MDGTTLPRSLYAATASAAPPTPPLDGHHRVDFAIVGGGFTGLSTALHLAEAGHEALVLEAREPGWGASGRNGGQVNPGLKHDPDDIEAAFGAELGQRMIGFSYGAPDFTFALIRRLAIDCEARQGGTLRAAASAASAAAVARTAEQCVRRGMPVVWLDQAAAHAATGTDRYRAALLDRRGGDLQPLSYARGLARAAMAAGAKIHGNTAATALAPNEGGWRIVTPRGAVQARCVLIATNGYTDGLWPGLAQSVVPVFSSIVASEPLSPALAATILKDRPVIYEAGRITMYCRIDQQNRLVFGGRGPMHPIDDPDRLPMLRRHAERLWPALKGVGWTHGWNGRVAVTTDHRLHIHALAPGLLACLGYNGRGVALSTAMGAQLARRLIDPNATLDMKLDAVRPITLHRFWPVGVQAAVVKGRVLDRLGV